MTGWIVDKDVEIGDYFDRKSRQTAGPEGFPHFHTKGKKENMELNWSIIFSPFCGKLLPLIHRIQGVDKGTGGNVDSYFVTVYSSARKRVTQSLRAWYNDCAKRNPARLYRAAPLCGDYTVNPRLERKMPPSASLSPLRAWYNDCAVSILE